VIVKAGLEEVQLGMGTGESLSMEYLEFASPKAGVSNNIAAASIQDRSLGTQQFYEHPDQDPAGISECGVKLK
jgi:hypothetical protein